VRQKKEIKPIVQQKLEQKKQIIESSFPQLVHHDEETKVYNKLNRS
jgi:hypothetical protein